MQIHVLAFEGPDAYSRAGGLASRVEGLTEALQNRENDVHLWFVGDPDAPYEEQREALRLHRWCQPISRFHPQGVYAGEIEKEADYARALPPRLFRAWLRPAIERGEHPVILAEEWQTARAAIHLHQILCDADVRQHVTIFWNANNTFGFEGIDWAALRAAACITTVSRYMKHRMGESGVEALAIPNGLAPDAYSGIDRSAAAALRARLRDRLLLTKMARWDPDKAWLATIETAAALKRRGWKPFLVARGDANGYGDLVLHTACELGLRVADRYAAPGPAGLVRALEDAGDVDVVNLRSHVDPETRRTLFRASDAVLANSSHEPFGLVGLETMAAGGLACTGCSGEDYAVPGQNAIVLETGDPREFIGLYERLRSNPREHRALRRAGRATARRYSWPAIVDGVLLPRIELQRPRRAQADYCHYEARREGGPYPVQSRDALPAQR